MEIDIQELEKRKKELLEALRRAEKARNEADGRMQSRYDTQKEEYALEVALLQYQIRRLEKEIEQLSKLTTKPNCDEDTVAVGHTVKLQIGNNEPSDIILVEDSDDRSTDGRSVISVKSSIGSAILGKKVGDTVSVILPEGETNVRIMSVGGIAVGHVVKLQIGNDEPFDILLVEDFGGRSIGGKSVISRKSPIGSAILGKKVGDTVSVILPEGEVNVHILSIE